MIVRKFTKWLFPSVMFGGYSKTINSQAVTVLQEDSNEYPLLVRFDTAAITDGGAGYSQGCRHIKDNGDGTTSIYQNEGDETSCDFNLVESVAAVITGVTAGNFVTGGGTEGTVTMNVGVRVRNNTGTQINVGSLLKVTGWNAAQNLPEVEIADPEAGDIATLVTTHDIADQGVEDVYPVVTWSGLDTSAFSSVGDPVYVNAAGGFSKNAPSTPYSHEQVVGYVTVVDPANGSIFFCPGLQIFSRYSEDTVAGTDVSGWVTLVEDFLGRALDTTNSPWATKDTSAAGSPTLAHVADEPGGAFQLAFDATDEEQILTLYGGDQRVWGIDQSPIIDFRVKNDALNANDTLVIGMAADQADVEDNITESAWFRLEAADLKVYLESDDGTNDNNDVDSGQSYVADTWMEMRIDFSDTSDVRFYAKSGGKWNDVNNGNTFDMSNFTGVLQPFAQLHKSGGTHTTSATIDYIKVRAER